MTIVFRRFGYFYNSAGRVLCNLQCFQPCFAVTRVMFLIFSIPKPEANAKTGSTPGTVLKSRGRCLSVNL